MTTDQILAYYAGLLPAQFKSLPNAQQTIEVLAALAIMPQGGNVVVDGQTGDPVFVNGQLVVDGPYGDSIAVAVSQAFNIATAQGQQLKFLAEQIGASNTGLNLSGQQVTLSDQDFRLLLQAAGARNFLRATGPAIDLFLFQFFQGILTREDNFNMHVTFNYFATLGSKNWAELFITQGFLPRGLAVGYAIAYVNPLTGPFFGFTSTISPAGPGVGGMTPAASPLTGSYMNSTEILSVP